MLPALLLLALAQPKDPPVWFDEGTRLGPAYNLDCRGGGIQCQLSGTTLYLGVDGGAAVTTRAACSAGQFVTAIDGGSLTCASMSPTDGGTSAFIEPFTYETTPFHTLMPIKFYGRPLCNSTNWAGPSNASYGTSTGTYSAEAITDAVTGIQYCAHKLTNPVGTANPSVVVSSAEVIMPGVFDAWVGVRTGTVEDAGVYDMRMWTGIVETAQTTATANADTMTGTHGIGFLYSHQPLPSGSQDRNIYCCSRDGSGQTCSDTGQDLQANAHYLFEIERLVSGTAVFKINGTVVCTKTTNLPAGNYGKHFLSIDAANGTIPQKAIWITGAGLSQ